MPDPDVGRKAMTGLGVRIRSVGATAKGRARRFLRRFMTRRGGVAMMFGLSFIPLSMLTLTAIDFHRASTIKSALQGALDSAALAAARSEATDPNEIQAIGLRVLQANMGTYPDATVSNVNILLNEDGTISATARVDVDPLVSDLFLGGPMNVNAAAEVVRANDKLEIALVLDNTGSMAGTKIATLRTAAANLVDDLTEAARSNPDPDAIKIGLVPFSMTVRLDPDYQNAVWIDGSARSSLHDLVFDGAGNRFAMLNKIGLSWAGCVESRPYPHDVQESPPHPNNSDTLYVPYFAPDTPDTDQVWAFRYYSSENDYLPDGISSSSSSYGKWFKHQGRTQKYRKNGLDTSNGKGPNRGCTMEPIARLTADTDEIKTSISNMVATGNTNIPMGLMWGWHLLSPNAPFRDGAPYDDDEVTKVVILMTDGDNVNSGYYSPNESTYSGLGYIWMERLGLGLGSSDWARTRAMDERLAELCDNMKTQGIVLYTVRVEVKSGSSSLLQNCASKADYFYDVQNVADLGDAFEQIAGQISRLRISR